MLAYLYDGSIQTYVRMNVGKTDSLGYGSYTRREGLFAGLEHMALRLDKNSARGCLVLVKIPRRGTVRSPMPNAES
jgi:hypothetical protein